MSKLKNAAILLFFLSLVGSNVWLLWKVNCLENRLHINSSNSEYPEQIKNDVTEAYNKSYILGKKLDVSDKFTNEALIKLAKGFENDFKNLHLELDNHFKLIQKNKDDIEYYRKVHYSNYSMLIKNAQADLDKKFNKQLAELEHYQTILLKEVSQIKDALKKGSPFPKVDIK